MDLRIIALVELLKRYPYVPCKDPSKKDITTIEVALNSKCIDIELV